MVEIFICRTSRLGYIRLEGHAGGLDENGSDVVCAGVSTITTMLAQVLDDNTDIFNSKISLKSGDTEIEYKVMPGYENKANTIIDTVLTGYYLLENTRPDCVKIHPQLEREST